MKKKLPYFLSPGRDRMLEQNIITQNLINFTPSAANRDSALTEMAELFFKEGRITDKNAYLKNVLEREDISSTNTGIGVAIPHGKGPFVESSAIAISRFSKGLEWDAGGEPVRAVFLLAVDDDEEGLAHLEVIAKVSTMLMDDDFLELLFNADSAEILFKEIQRRLEEEN